MVVLELNVSSYQRRTVTRFGTRLTSSLEWDRGWSDHVTVHRSEMGIRERKGTDPVSSPTPIPLSFVAPTS